MDEARGEMKKVVATGGARFIGSYLAENLETLLHTLNIKNELYNNQLFVITPL